MKRCTLVTMSNQKTAENKKKCLPQYTNELQKVQVDLLDWAKVYLENDTEKPGKPPPFVNPLKQENTRK